MKGSVDAIRKTENQVRSKTVINDLPESSESLKSKKQMSEQTMISETRPAKPKPSQFWSAKFGISPLKPSLIQG